MIQATDDYSRLSACELIERAKEILGVHSLYALANELNLPPNYVQRYYRKNAIPLPVRTLIIRVINDG